MEQDVGAADWKGMAARLDKDSGLLEVGVSVLGSLQLTLSTLGLEPTNIESKDLAYGVGQVPAPQALPHLPEGACWVAAVQRFTLSDGRNGWYLSGEWFASPRGAASVFDRS